jgi:ribose 5-phosphate isomerase A
MERSESQKKAAAEAAVDQVQSGMLLGLGTGSTARYAISRLGQRVREGALERLICVPTSEDTARRAQAEGLTLSSLATHPALDLAIDGADEVDPQLDLIKGLGGARAARRFVVFVDQTKQVERLGARAPVPVEVASQSAEALEPVLRSRGCRPLIRGGSAPYVTDNGNWIIDCHFDGGIPDPPGLGRFLDALPEVKAHGLFLGMAHEVLIGTPSGVERRERRR